MVIEKAGTPAGFFYACVHMSAALRGGVAAIA